MAQLLCPWCGQLIHPCFEFNGACENCWADSLTVPGEPSPWAHLRAALVEHGIRADYIPPIDEPAE
jgi:hypothetical protein